MTDRERQFAAIGFGYAEGIEQAMVVHCPNGREIRRTEHGTWETQPLNDNYWREFSDLLDAAKFATGKTDGLAATDFAEKYAR
jgi:hypothetical protein